MDSATAYPDALRRVTYLDVETKKRFKFLTNNFTLPALTIAQIYKCRWQVELFFKWIKQHLRIKAFFGTSENAVKTQIEASLYQILQILSVTLFEKTPVLRALQASDFKDNLDDSGNQLILCDPWPDTSGNLSIPRNRCLPPEDPLYACLAHVRAINASFNWASAIESA
jgi:predicted xylose isomerase-like sugar epimerase